MSATTEFFTMVLIFWIGYERLWEVISDLLPKSLNGAKKKGVIYLTGLVIGFIFSLYFGLTVAQALVSDGWTLNPAYLQFDSIFITPLLFAGGPDLIHQVIALIQQAKVKIKDENGT